MAFKLVYNPAISNAQNVKALSSEPAQVPDGTIKSNMVARKDLSYLFYDGQIAELVRSETLTVNALEA